MNKKQSKTIEELMKTEEKTESQEENDNLLEKKKPKKTWWVLLGFVCLAIFLIGGYFIYNNILYTTDEKTNTNNEKIETKPAITEEKAKEDKVVYVKADGGLNLRKEASRTAEVLTIIPNGTALTVLQEQGDWYQVAYNSQTGWIVKEFTTESNPLSYQNDEFGFSLIFPAAWTGYKIYKKTADDGSINLFVQLPTKDQIYKNINETNEAGYVSMFVVSVLTQAQWDAIKNEEGPKPTYLGQNTKYIFAWSSAQATATDTADRFKENKTVIDTFKTL